MTPVHSESTARAVVAILTMPDAKRLFRGNYNNFKDLAQTGAEHNMLVYVTTVDDFTLAAKWMNGYLYDSTEKKWMKSIVPAPHVVYNRIPTRKEEFNPKVKQLIQQCLNRKNMYIFNPFFFNKWTLFKWLNRSNMTKKYIPATIRLRSYDDVKPFIKKYKTLFLKPASGKAGKGIMKIECIHTKEINDTYSLSVQEKKNSHKYIFNNSLEMWKTIKGYIEGEDYIIQQGIHLTRYRNRPFDLRVLVQKNSEAKWKISGIGARVAGKLSITTHVPRGGSIDDPLKLLETAYGAVKAKRLVRQLRSSALLIAKQIEKASGHKLGEMSMDLGIDTSGHIWFFEANSKPMKFDEPQIRKRSLERIMHYCQYLSKQEN